IGGVLLALSGPKLAFTVNALSYTLMILVLLRWRPRPTGRDDKHPMLPAIGTALRFCASSSPIRRVLTRGFAFGLGATAHHAPFRRRLGPEAIVSGAMLLSALALAGLAASTSVTHALLASFLAGGGQVAALTSLNVSMQLRSPDEILGRCLAIFQALAFGGFAVGSWLWGMVSDAAGLAAALLGAALWLFLALAVLRVLAPMPRIGEGTVTPGQPGPAP